MTVRVIEATSDKELGEKVAFAINTLSMIPFADWQYNNGLFQVLVMSGTASDVGAFTLLWGSSSLELAAQRDMHTEEGWVPFGSIKYLRGKYVQALARGVPTGGGGPVDIYSDNIVDATAIGKGILTAPLAADVHALLGAGAAGLDVYGLETKEEIVTYLDIQTGSITADQITDATAIGKSVLRAATTFAAQTAIGASNIGRQVFTATTTAAAQQAIGGGQSGRPVFSATSTTELFTALGLDRDATSSLKAVRYGGFTNRDFLGTGSLHTLTLGTNGSAITGGSGYLTVSPWTAETSVYRQPAVYLRRSPVESGHTRIGFGVATSATGLVGIAAYEDLVLIQRSYNTDIDTMTVNAAMVTRNITPNEDANRDLGSTAMRFNNLYLANAPIVTSDANLKINKDFIGDLVLDAWADVHYVQYRNVQGDRLHFGVLAQNVKETFEAHGLDPFAYGLLCWDEWEADEETGLEAGGRYGVRYQECMVLEMALTRRTIKRLQSGA